jgi:hypothetical protein
MYKIRIILFAVLLILGALYIFSCKKDISAEPIAVYKIVTGTKWKLDAIYFTDSPYVQWANFTTQIYSPCELNDIYEFKKDSLLSRKRTDTITNCTHASAFMPDDGAVWYLDAADTHLIIAKQSFLAVYRYDCKILKLDNISMKLQSNFTNYFGSPSAWIFSFKATP